MAHEEDVVRIARKLDKMIAKKEVCLPPSAFLTRSFSPSTTSISFFKQVHVNTVDLLRCLRDKPINLEILQKTRIGMIVNNLRKSTNDEEITSLSKVRFFILHS